MRNYSLADFTAAVGDDFELAADDGTLTLKLAAAEALPTSLRPGGSFRLEWIGPHQPVLPQAIYRLACGGDRHELFLVPIGHDQAGIHYEAIFN